jgi:flagellar basal-body rod protein FlgG
MPNGDVNYTRNDSLKLDSLGQMVTSNGNPIQPTITIPSDAISITIGTDGVVSVLQRWS